VLKAKSGKTLISSILQPRSSIFQNPHCAISYGFGKRNQVRQKRMQLQRLDTNIQEASQNIDMNYRNAQQQLGVSRKSVSAQSENLQLAEKVYRQTLLLYQEGMAGMTDLLETESSLSEAKTTYTAELIRYKKTEIDLLKASGRLEALRMKE
jgi:outer membrane protein TolC